LKAFAIAVALTFVLIPGRILAIEQVEFKQELSGAGNPFDAATDEDGNIYMTDAKRQGVSVLDRDGKETAFWGGKKTKETLGWQLDAPSGIAVYKDRVYVADADGDSIFIFSKDGKYLESFGAGGSGPKEFSKPLGICAGRGIVFVADSGNRRIQVFSPDGIYLNSIGEGRLGGPLDVGVDYRGYIYVADKDNITVFTPPGTHYATYHTVKEPSGMAVDKSGFFVADNGTHQVKKFDFSGNQILSFGAGGKGKAQFREISGVSIDAYGNVFVVDSDKKTLQIFSTKTVPLIVEEAPYPATVSWVKDLDVKADDILWDGTRLYGVSRKDNSLFTLETDKVNLIGGQGKLNPWKRPGGMAVAPDGALWMADTGGGRILKVDASGKVVFTVGSAGGKAGYLSGPEGIAISPGGVIYVADTGNSRVQAFNKDGVFLREMKGVGVTILEEPAAVALDASENLYVLDRGRAEVFIFDNMGNFVKDFGGKGSAWGRLDSPSDIIVTATEVMVLDAGNRRVQVFDLKGDFLRGFGAGGRGKGDFRGPSSFALKDETSLFLSDPEGGRIQLLNLIYTPGTPANLHAQGGMRSVVLTWEGTAEDFIDYFTVYRSDDKINYTQAGLAATNGFEDRGVEPDRLYYYRVSASARDGNESGPSNVATVQAVKFIPSPPPWYSVSPSEREIAIAWQASPEAFVTGYSVYREDSGTYVLLDGNAQSPFVDRKVRPETPYTYRLSAVSSDALESDAIIIKTATLKQTRPPVDIEVASMGSIFSNNYKLYEQEPFGSVKVSNNTWEPISKVKVFFMIREFMDFPAEQTAENIEPGQSMTLPLNAVFNNKVLELTENTAVQAEVKAVYYENQELRTFTTTQSVNIYEKHHLTWDVRERIATFITPKDPVVLDFAREIARQYSDENPDPFIYARVIFDAMGVLGVSYMADPNNPYQVSSERVDQVDYIQYPRETLLRRTGDCDDLVNLYASALESLGVQTALLDMPGHILMMFSTGMDEGVVGGDELGDMFVIHEGAVWAPVEVTLVGSSFLSAWKKGVEFYEEGRQKGLVVIDPKKAWETFKPASLPSGVWKPEPVRREDIEAKFGDELGYLKGLKMRFASKKYLDVLGKDSSDIDALLQVGILYGESGDERAVEFFGKVLSLEPGNAAAMNNLGNVHFGKGRYAEAAEAYEAALVLDPNDPHMWINLVKCYLKSDMELKAKEAFDRAVALDPDVPRRYRSLSMQFADPTFFAR